MTFKVQTIWTFLEGNVIEIFGQGLVELFGHEKR